MAKPFVTSSFTTAGLLSRDAALQVEIAIIHNPLRAKSVSVTPLTSDDWEVLVSALLRLVDASSHMKARFTPTPGTSYQLLGAEPTFSASSC